jgi:hypothetical protein
MYPSYTLPGSAALRQMVEQTSETVSPLLSTGTSLYDSPSLGPSYGITSPTVNGVLIDSTQLPSRHTLGSHMLHIPSMNDTSISGERARLPNGGATHKAP